MDKRQKIRLLLKINNAVINFEQTADEDLLPPNLEGDPAMDQFRDFYLQGLKKLADTITERQVEIYDKYLSEKAIDGALEYFQTEAGAEHAANSANISREMAALSADVSNRIIEEYHTTVLKTDIDEMLNTAKLINNTEDTSEDLNNFVKKYNLE